MSSIPNLGASLGGVSCLLDGNTYAANERAGWARDDFGSLFEQRLRMSESRADGAGGQPGMGNGTFDDDPGVVDAETERAADAGLNTSVCDFGSPMSAVDAINLEQPAVDLDGNGVAAAGFRNPTADGGGLSAERSQGVSAPDRALPLVEARAAPAESSVIVHIEDGVVAACIRNAGMDEAEAEQLVASLRSQLAMQGMSLGSLRLNGESLWQQGGGLAPTRSGEAFHTNESVTNTMEMNNVG